MSAMCDADEELAQRFQRDEDALTGARTVRRKTASEDELREEHLAPKKHAATLSQSAADEVPP